MSPSAVIIADSISEQGCRVTTFEITCHRFVLAEFNTHRVISRNSASSRAIPVSKQIRRIEENLALPVAWPSEQSGMQGGEALSPEEQKELEVIWAEAAEDTILFVDLLVEKGLHKSVTNRLLEPFMWHTIVCTSTAWENFFAQRCSPLAQPEIRAVAELMRGVYEASTPKLVHEGQWHLPYIQDEEWEDPSLDLDAMTKISAARCARVSYLTQDGVRDHSKDLELYDRLIGARPMHASPLEHVCTPAKNMHKVNIFRTGKSLELTLPKYGNFLGWHQLRYDVEAEIQYQSFA